MNVALWSACRRVWLPLALMTSVVLGLASSAQAVPVTKPPGEKISRDTLQTWIEDLGYEVTPVAGNSLHAVETKIEHDDISYQVRFTMSGSEEFIYFQTCVAVLPTEPAARAAAIEKFLAANWQADPSVYKLDPSGKYVYCSMPVDNRGLTRSALRARLDIYLSLLTDHRKLWEVAPAAAPVATTPPITNRHVLGRWQVVRVTNSTDPEHPADARSFNLTIEFHDNVAVSTRDGQVLLTATAVVSGKGTEGTLDLISSDGKVERSIFKIEDGRMTLCSSLPDGERPTEFAASDKAMLIELERIDDAGLAAR